MNESREQMIDRFGATASGLCALHCAICALLPAAFAALGLGVLLSHNVENGLAGMAILFGLTAIRLAWTTHRSPAVTALLACGIVGLIGARSLEMSSSHDHHGAEEHAAHHTDDEHDEHDKHDEHDEHDDDNLHLAGSSIGVSAGLMLAIGHLLNLRAVARCREECCDPEPTVS